MIRRVQKATTFGETVQRANCAALAIHHLKIARDFARYAPHTKNRIHRALTSAAGALRHANRMVNEQQRKAVR